MRYIPDAIACKNIARRDATTKLQLTCISDAITHISMTVWHDYQPTTIQHGKQFSSCTHTHTHTTDKNIRKIKCAMHAYRHHQPNSAQSRLRWHKTNWKIRSVRLTYDHHFVLDFMIGKCVGNWWICFETVDHFALLARRHHISAACISAPIWHIPYLLLRCTYQY